MPSIRRAFTSVVLSAFCFLLSACSGGGTSAAPVQSMITIVLSPSTTSLSLNAVTGSSTSGVVTLTSSGTASVTVTGITLAGANASSFAQSNTCGTTITSTCSVTVQFSPAAAGSYSATLSVADNATGSPQTVTLTGTATSTATAGNTVDCSVAGGACPALTLAGDPISAGGFHGYADPAMRKDPNSSSIYLAYSWPRTLADATHVVDLHLALSTDGGKTFTYVGSLYQSQQVTQSTSANYAATNDTSTETIDLIPVPLTGASAGQTLWVEAHQSYLVKPQQDIYTQINQTDVIVVKAVQLSSPAGAGAATALLALGSASTPSARLAGAGPDATLNVTQRLSSLNTTASKCAYFGQPALWYDASSSLLYMGLECVQANGNVDANDFAHFLFSTTPTGADASQWTWSYKGEFATMADAKYLSLAETGSASTYGFFTEPQFALSKTTGQLLVLLTPAIITATGQQPVIQYGCRAVPVQSLASATLSVDATSKAPVVAAKITESDLYTGVNEGPAACTYEPASASGVVIGRKYENDPSLGFYIYPVATGITP